MKRNKNSDALFDAIEVSLTPLIDTVLVLLIIFIVATPLATEFVSISLPHSSGQTIEKVLEKNFCFAINQYGQLFNQDQQVISENAFCATIGQQVAKDENSSFVIFADKDALSGTVVHLIEKARQAGAKYVYCATKKISF